MSGGAGVSVGVSVGGAGVSVGDVVVGGFSPPFSGVLVDVGLLVPVGVISRRVADGDGVGVLEGVGVAVALGVKVAVAVFVAVTVGVAVGVFVMVLAGSTTGTTLVAALVAIGVGPRVGPTAAYAVAQMASKASRIAAPPSILRVFLWRARTNSAAGKRLVSVGLTCARTRASLRADRMSLALANRFATGTSIARRITRSTSGEIAGLISRSVRNAPGLETRRVTVAGGSSVSR